MRRIPYILLLLFALSSSGMRTSAETPKREYAEATDVPTLTITQGAFTVKGPLDCALTFEVYSLTGQLVKKFKLKNGSFTLELPRGCYIIKCSIWSKKVVIKG